MVQLDHSKQEIKIVVDTNVILEHNNLFWNELVKKVPVLDDEIKDRMKVKSSFTSFKILIPQTVIEEIDNLKKVTTNNKGYVQRKQIQRLYLYNDKLEFIDDLKEGLSENFTTEFQKQDNIILNTTINLSKSSHVILYTNDIQLLLKQKIHKISTFTDIEKIDVSSLTDNIEYIEVNDEIVNQLISDGYIHNSLNLKKGYYVLYSNEDMKELVKVKNEDIIEHIPFIDKNKMQSQSFGMKPLFPKSIEQQLLMDQIFDNDVKLITTISPSGTGKTLIQLYGQICLLNKSPNLFKKITFIVNPTTTNGKDIGYLPGDKHEKIVPYMQGIVDNLNYLFQNEIPESLDIEKFEKTDMFEIRPLQFIRGSSITHSIVIVDEVQNLTLNDIKTVVSRVQNNSKLILLGDIQQIDEKMQVDYTGIMRFINFLNKHKEKLDMWVNITLKDRVRNNFLNILSDFFDESE